MNGNFQTDLGGAGGGFDGRKVAKFHLKVSVGHAVVKIFHDLPGRVLREHSYRFYR